MVFWAVLLYLSPGKWKTNWQYLCKFNFSYIKEGQFICQTSQSKILNNKITSRTHFILWSCKSTISSQDYILKSASNSIKYLNLGLKCNI